MKDCHKKYKLHCKTLSPIHIGSGEVLSRWEYLIYNNKLYKPKDEFWTAWNKKSPDSINNIVNKINGDDPGSSLTSYLKVSDEKALDKYFIELSMNLKLSSDEKICNINLFSGSPDYIIPGSSIKGAIRTGITVKELSKQLKSDKDKREVLNNIRYDEKKLFGFNSNHSKEFQNIQISDVKLKSEDLSIVEIKYLKDDTFISAETLDENINFTIEITQIKYRSNNQADFQDELLKTTSEFYKSVWRKLSEDKKYVPDFYNSHTDEALNNNNHLFRLGFGSGQLSNSILFPWQEIMKDDTLLRNGKASKRGVYPSTIKRTNNMPLGWVLITKIEEC